jgi:hypothetical protein
MARDTSSTHVPTHWRAVLRSVLLRVTTLADQRLPAQYGTGAGRDYVAMVRHRPAGRAVNTQTAGAGGSTTPPFGVISSRFETEHGYQELPNRRRFLRR